MYRRRCAYILQAQQQRIRYPLHSHLVNIASLLRLQRYIIATRGRHPAHSTRHRIGTRITQHKRGDASIP